MTISDKRERLLRRVISVSVVLNSALLVFGILLYPSVLGEGGLLGLGAASAILLIYGFLALFSPMAVGKVSPRSLRIGLQSGVIGGVLLSVDLVVSYFVNADTGARDSLVAYGIFLLLLLVAGIRGTSSTERFAAGVQAAIWGVLIALLLWFSVEFAAYYLLSATPSGAQFIAAEMQADFERSGASDFLGFVMSDFYGAGFFHLLLGLIFATLLGSVGALIGIALSRFRRER